MQNITAFRQFQRQKCENDTKGQLRKWLLILTAADVLTALGLFCFLYFGTEKDVDESLSERE